MSYSTLYGKLERIEKSLSDKTKKVSINVTNNELEALEDALVAWTLCKKHNRDVWNKTQIETFSIQSKCKACTRANKAVQRKAIGVMSKLFRAYDADKKR